MLTITINPETGMPEAFLKGLRRLGSKITKPIRRVAKSKAFKTIAPIALAIAAPYALGALAPSVFGSAALGGGTALGGMFASGTALGAAATTGIGSLIGGLASRQKFGDAAKGALLSAATAGLKLSTLSADLAKSISLILSLIVAGDSSAIIISINSCWTSFPWTSFSVSGIVINS